MEVIYDRESDQYYQRRNVDNQTVELGMNCTNWDEINKTSYWNIFLTVYNKRKDAYTNMDKKVITGQNPFATFIMARDMFYDVEAEVLKKELLYGHSDKVIIFCTWVDNRRRDAYYRVLSKMGYNWGLTPNLKHKCIIKTFTKENLTPEVLKNVEN